MKIPDISKAIKQAVNNNFTHQLRLLKDLVKTDSTNPFTPDTSDPKAPIEKAVSDRLYLELKSLGFSPKRIGVTTARPNLTCTWGSPRYRKSLIFNGHMDTVPLPESSTAKTLLPVVKNNRLYGRGSLDMKASLSAYVFALKAIKDSRLPLSGKLILEFVVDEEPGACSQLGTRYLISQGITAKAAIIAEPGHKVGIGHRGGYRFKLTTLGESVHTGDTKWQKKEVGHNAVSDMAKVIAVLDQLDIPYKPSRLFPGKKPVFTFPTLIKGGTAINIVPEQCIAYGDVRLMPGNSDKQVRLLIEEKLAHVNNLRYSLENLLYAPAVELDDKEEIVNTVKNTFATIQGKTPLVQGIGPWNDAWMLWHLGGIPTITQVPLEGGNAHAANEWVSLKSLIDLTVVLAITAIRYLGANDDFS